MTFARRAEEDIEEIAQTAREKAIQESATAWQVADDSEKDRQRAIKVYHTAKREAGKAKQRAEKAFISMLAIPLSNPQLQNMYK